MKEFSCGAVVPGCSARFEADSEEEILQQVAVHAREAHGMQEVPPDVVQQVRDGITES
jgi:predicted small metal-binding protein